MKPLTCKRHPRYQGRAKPRVLCATCWVIFLGMHEACVNVGCQHMETEEDIEEEDDEDLQLLTMKGG